MDVSLKFVVNHIYRSRRFEEAILITNIKSEHIIWVPSWKDPCKQNDETERGKQNDSRPVVTGDFFYCFFFFFFGLPGKRVIPPGKTTTLFGQGGAMFRVSKHGCRELELISVFLRAGWGYRTPICENTSSWRCLVGTYDSSLWAIPWRLDSVSFQKSFAGVKKSYTVMFLSRWNACWSSLHLIRPDIIYNLRGRLQNFHLRWEYILFRPVMMTLRGLLG